MRSLAASVLAVGILLGGAGAALANDGVGMGYFNAGGAGASSHCSASGVPSVYGTIFTGSCHEKAWEVGPEGAFLGAH
ncbi:MULTISPECIES: hypothetical protein [Streptomyces]|uniref:hypothetical protein n=1 Tax=Streptomyces TaxID=1883 RepID=UPI0003019C4D|nr:hypothetical protein [Streptomyces venezuelae]APE20134.1 hypothetical protein vnz_03350 [Streptomyces venezuelae]QER97535.1 hypothetical protein DEJ43_03385 [Streptomyces venezuelae ATCC 10712]QES04722.1 hypothetical protein DEJ44_03260 [Streptomyces venezuelae]QES16535.1 hypothetical protein DEJ45_31900 [Streptomyces venezuelae]